MRPFCLKLFIIFVYDNAAAMRRVEEEAVEAAMRAHRGDAMVQQWGREAAMRSAPCGNSPAERGRVGGREGRRRRKGRRR